MTSVYQFFCRPLVAYIFLSSPQWTLSAFPLVWTFVLMSFHLYIFSFLLVLFFWLLVIWLLTKVCLLIKFVPFFLTSIFKGPYFNSWAEIAFLNGVGVLGELSNIDLLIAGVLKLVKVKEIKSWGRGKREKNKFQDIRWNILLRIQLEYCNN